MKQLEIIDNYRDLPVGKYEEIVRLCNEPMGEVERKVAVIAILSNKTEDEVLHLPLDKFTEYSRKSRFIEEQCPENLIPPVAKSYPVGDFVLVPVSDMRKITAAQYIDFQTFAKEKETRTVEMLSCFLVPKGMDYNEGYDVLEVHDAIRREMSVAQVLALLAFFFGQWLKSTHRTLTSSMRLLRRNPEMRKEMEAAYKKLMDSLLAGDGSPM